MMTASVTDDSRIGAITCSRPWTEEELTVEGEVFLDCTGDGTLGFEAGADFSIGREGPGERPEDLPHRMRPNLSLEHGHW